MKQYIDFLNNILTHGNVRSDRTGTGTVSVFGGQMSFDLKDGFPLVTTKKIAFRLVVEELLWFLRGSTNGKELTDKKVNIWNNWMLDEHDIRYTFEERIVLLKAKDFLWVEKDTVEYEKSKYSRTNHEALAYFKPIFESYGVPVNRPLQIGELGPVYGAQWRSWNGIDQSGKKRTIDQISELIDNLKKKPFSRRHIVSAWNVNDLPDESISPQANVLQGKMALAPCHTLFQFYVEYQRLGVLFNELDWDQKKEYETIFGNIPDPDETSSSRRMGGLIDIISAFNEELTTAQINFFESRNVKTKRLSLQLYQRSMDGSIGAPFNIASYALLLSMVAQVTNMVPGNYIHTVGDAHIYKDHILTDGRYNVYTQLAREPYPMPQLHLNPEVKSIFDFTVDDISLINYQSHSVISFPIAV